MTWQQQLDEIVTDNLFGTNIEWPLNDVKRYLSQLEALGAQEIKILDRDSVQFVISKEATEILLFVLTGGKMPSSVSFNRKNRRVVLNWDY